MIKIKNKQKHEDLAKEIQKESEQLRRIEEDFNLKNMRITCLNKVRNKITRLRNWVKESYQRKEKEELVNKELQEKKMKLINLDAFNENLAREQTVYKIFFFNIFKKYLLSIN